MSVGPDQVQNIELLRIYRTSRGMIDLTFSAQLTISAVEVKTLFNSLDEKEFAELRIFSAVEAKIEVGLLGGHRAKKVDLIY